MAVPLCGLTLSTYFLFNTSPLLFQVFNTHLQDSLLLLRKKRIIKESSVLWLLKWVRFTDEFRWSLYPIVLIHCVFPHSIMFRIHSPPPCVEQRQERLSFRANTNDTTDDSHISPVMVGTGQGVMFL